MKRRRRKRMKLGAFLNGSIPGQPLAGELDSFIATNGVPDTAPIIVRDRMFPWGKVGVLEDRGIDPMIYLTSHGWDHSASDPIDYAELEGFAREVKLYGDWILIRLPHEHNTPSFPAPWNMMSRSAYLTMFIRMSRTIKDIAPNASISMCLAWNGKDNFSQDVRNYNIGSDFDRWGLDVYAKNDALKLDANIEKAVGFMKGERNVAVDILESGIDVDLDYRQKGLVQALNRAALVGVRRFTYTDQNLIEPANTGIHQWLMNNGMRSKWKDFN